MTVLLSWWLKNYEKRITETVRGETAAECMAQIVELKTHHDVAKFTPISIDYISDD